MIYFVPEDEDPEKIGRGKETCVTLIKSSRGGWFLWDVDEGFISQDKDLQDMVDEYLDGSHNWSPCIVLSRIECRDQR